MGNDEKELTIFSFISIKIQNRFIVIFEHYISAKQYTLLGQMEVDNRKIFTHSAKEGKKNMKYVAYGVTMIMMIKKEKKNNTISIRC